MNPEIFREYDIRGIAGKDIKEEDVVLIGKAVGTYLMGKGKTTLSVGRDCRTTSPTYSNKVIEGLLSTGCDDNIFHPIRDDEVPVFVDPAHVPRVEPAVNDGLGCLFGVVEIALEHGRPFDEYFVPVPDLYLGLWYGLTDGTEFGISREVDRYPARRLRLTVDLPHVDAQRVVELQ